MNLWEWLEANQGAITAAAAVLLLLVVYFQLRMGRRAFKKGDERVKKQSTLEFYASVMDSVVEDRRLISAKYGKDKIGSTEARKLYDAAYKTEQDNIDDKTVDLSMAVRNYLNALERLAVGVFLNVYDVDILKRLAFAHFHYVRTQFPAYIAEVQKELDLVHEEAKRLADEWKDNPPESGWGGEGALGLTLRQKAARRLRDYFAKMLR